jgi:hypothetical protein
MEPKDKTEGFTLDRREMLKTMGAAAAGMAAGGLTSAEAGRGNGRSAQPPYLATFRENISSGFLSRTGPPLQATVIAMKLTR